MSLKRTTPLRPLSGKEKGGWVRHGSSNFFVMHTPGSREILLPGAYLYGRIEDKSFVVNTFGSEADTKGGRIVISANVVRAARSLTLRLRFINTRHCPIISLYARRKR